MRKDKHEDCCITRSLAYIGHGEDIVRKFYAWKVLDILVLGVNDIAQLLAVHVLLEDPHWDIPLEKARVFPIHNIFRHDLCNDGPPISGADDADFFATSRAKPPSASEEAREL